MQAYGKRAIPVIRWLRRLSERTGKRIPLRLVKGAYWDSEIKWAQERGLADYPVLTRKLHTDVSYLACMRLILSDPGAFYAQFATHNAHTVASAIVAAGQTDFEFQRLHGMGEALYAEIVGAAQLARACRIYAPVGEHEDLLSYLVRRLLENGANTSFVNRLADDEAPVAQIIRDPVETAERERLEPRRRKLLPRPRDIFWPERKNSTGIALDGPRRPAPAPRRRWRQRSRTRSTSARSSTARRRRAGTGAGLVTCPHDRRERIGTVRIATPAQVEAAIASATNAAHGWDRSAPPARARILDYAADMIERDRARLMAVLVREAGKTLPAAQAEVREAVDLLRYYAYRGAPPDERADCCSRARRARPTRSSCARAARSRASRHGTSRSRSSRARSRPRSRPATRCWPSRPSRRPSPPISPRSCSTRPACRRTSCTS